MVGKRRAQRLISEALCKLLLHSRGVPPNWFGASAGSCGTLRRHAARLGDARELV